MQELIKKIREQACKMFDAKEKSREEFNDDFLALMNLIDDAHVKAHQIEQENNQL